MCSSGFSVTTCVSATVDVCNGWLSECAETGVLVGLLPPSALWGFWIPQKLPYSRKLILPSGRKAKESPLQNFFLGKNASGEEDVALLSWVMLQYVKRKKAFEIVSHGIRRNIVHYCAKEFLSKADT